MEIPRVPKSARVRGFQRIDSDLASLPLVGESENCSVKCAGQEIGSEEGGSEPGDVPVRPSRDGGWEAA